jgi:hypothetical protein
VGRRHNSIGQTEELTDHRVHEIRMEGHDIEAAGPIPMDRLDSDLFTGDEVLHCRQQDSPKRFSV